MPSTLAQLKVGETATIKQVVGDSPTCSRLRELGLTAETQVLFLRQAPFGGPMVFEFRGYQLCLRPSEAKLVELCL